MRELRGKGMKISEAVLPDKADVYIGDLVADGTGEIYLRHGDTG